MIVALFERHGHGVQTALQFSLAGRIGKNLPGFIVCRESLVAVIAVKQLLTSLVVIVIKYSAVKVFVYAVRQQHLPIEIVVENHLCNFSDALVS